MIEDSVGKVTLEGKKLPMFVTERWAPSWSWCTGS